MIKNLTCIICPRGCSLQVEISDKTVTVQGNACPKGEQYGMDESTNPTRTVTSVVRVCNRRDTMVSVKTEKPIPKENIFDLMEIIRKTELSAPVELGDVVIGNVFGTRVIATKQVK